jgi:AmmeMemoRadiSam system protein B
LKREPSVAGQFYYGNASRLTEQVEAFVDSSAKKEEILGMVSPHAGLVYSGHVAGKVFSSVVFPQTFILLGPNHTGLGSKISLMESGEWEIPTGTFSIDNKLSHKIASRCSLITKDSSAHLFEHSLEVQLPFIAYFSKTVKIVPIVMLSVTVEDCKTVGVAIADAVKAMNYPVVVVASSDMSHYVTDEIARKKDKLAIDRILSLDPEGLYETVSEERISMCGYIPVVTMLFAAKSLGAQSAKLLKYATSGEISGDYDHVVGYAGVVVR